MSADRFNLDKVSLVKPGQQFKLTKEADRNFDDILINLNWNSGPVKKPSFLDKILGRGGKSIDLDLGCLFELENGKRSAIQALGGSFGSFNRAPYITLDGDDRTGEVDGGENMRVNGSHWDKISRILVHASIYQGVAAWDQTDGVVTINATGFAPVEVALTNGDNKRPLCAVAMIENDDGAIKITRLVEYFSDHRDMDHAYSWGLSWVAGRK